MNRRHFTYLLWAGSAFAQKRKPPATPSPTRSSDDETITLDVTRVNLFFSVTDRKGRFVTNLTKEEFELHEAKKQQEIIEFAAESNLPLRIGVLIDTSNSIRERFRFELEACGEFLNGLIRKGQDKALVVAFDTESKLVCDLSDDLEDMNKRLRDLRPGGGTALYDAIAFSCKEKLSLDRPMHKFNRAMVIVGDGEDNASQLSRDQALEFAQKTDVKIFAISTNITKVETDGDKVLKYLAKETGGQAFFPFKAQDLAQDFENIAHELRSQYSILFKPEPLILDGLYHPIEVHVKGRKDLIVRARSGYYAPRK